MNKSHKKKRRLKRRIAILLAAILFVVPTSTYAWSVATPSGCYSFDVFVWPYASWRRQTVHSDYFYARSYHSATAYAGEGGTQVAHNYTGKWARAVAYGPFWGRTAGTYYNY